MADPVVFSLIVPVYKPVISELRECIESVRTQTYSAWQLCMALDGPQPPEVLEAIESYNDPRISVYERPENGGISAASQDALALATGEFIGLLDNDDTLATFALERVASVIATWPDTDFIYSDEDKLSAEGVREDHFPKPGWSPERLRCHMYTGHFTCYRTDLVHDVGGFRPGFDGSQDHDLALRVSERARRVVHIPEVLYHWRMSINSAAASPDAKPWAYDAGKRAVQSQLDRLGIDATADTIEGYPGYLRYQPNNPHPAKVSIVIPTAGTSKLVNGVPTRLVDHCVRSILERSDHQNVEIIVVLDQTAPLSMAVDLIAIDRSRISIVRNKRPFNYSEANNLGASYATGEMVLFLNDDTEIVQANWLDRMLMFSSIPGVGAVGVRLNYPDGRIQHAGVLGRTVPQHRARGAKHPYYGLMGGMQVSTQNLSIVTGACLMVELDKFFEVGGFNPELPLSYNDVDFCLKLDLRGYRNVLDMNTTVIHHESASRDETVNPHELTILNRRWKTRLTADPYDNPAFDHATSEELPPPAILTMLKEWGGERAAPRATLGWRVASASDSSS